MACNSASFAAALIVIATLLASGPTAAQTPPKTCTATSVSARGEPASYKWLALVKARGNWRARVRVTQDMGSVYADWSAAEDQVERCIDNAGSIVCTVTAIPCRR